MRKLITNGLLALSMVLSAGAANAQAVSKGNFIIDPYYGAPNFGSRISSSFVGSGGNGSNYRAVGDPTGIGPAGLRVEYMLADKFGLGVDFIYNSTVLNVEYDSLNNDGTLYRTYTGTASMNRFRIHARFNYHFVSTEELDAYVGVGAGTNSRVWTAKSNEPGYTFKERGTGVIFPASLRLAVGMRYYFIPNLGINAEIGIGGPLVSAGLSIKI